VLHPHGDREGGGGTEREVIRPLLEVDELEED